MSSLFLICPECFSEQELISEYGEDFFLLTSLGACFDQGGSSGSSNIQFLLNTHAIDKVCLFQATDCNFINQNFGAGREKIGIATEETFASDYQHLVHQPVVPISTAGRKLELAEKNVIRQMMFIENIVRTENPKKPQRTLVGLIFGGGKKFSDRSLIRTIADKHLNCGSD